jgi:quercetin dioxygenase-like cupin family protein
MRVTTIEQVPARAVELEGARSVKMRVLLGAEHGAPGFTMRLFELGPDGQTPQHRHAHEHEVIVQAGSGTLWSSRREWPLAPGSVVLVEPDEEHQFRAGPDGLSFFCIVPHAGHG